MLIVGREVERSDCTPRHLWWAVAAVGS